jgi:hypothetical protein
MATNLVDLAMFVFDDFKPGTYKGGEGNQLLLKAKRGGWPQTLFALHGRPLPVGPLVIYTIWSVLAIAMAQLVHLDPYGEPTLVLHVNVLGLSGSALFFLLVFRTNAWCARADRRALRALPVRSVPHRARPLLSHIPMAPSSPGRPPRLAATTDGGRAARSGAR